MKKIRLYVYSSRGVVQTIDTPDDLDSLEVLFEDEDENEELGKQTIGPFPVQRITEEKWEALVKSVKEEPNE